MGRSNCEAVLKKRLGRQHLCALISRYKIENRLDIPRIVVTNGRNKRQKRTNRRHPLPAQDAQHYRVPSVQNFPSHLLCLFLTKR